MLADLAAATSDHIKDVIIILGGLLALYHLVKKTVNPAREVREISPQPLQVTPAPQWIQRHEVMAQHGALESRVLRMETSFESLRAELRNDRVTSDQAQSARAEQLHRVVDELRTEVNNRISDMPSQIVALLRNAGVIKGG